MKKIYLLIFLLSLFFTISAQDILFHTGFDKPSDLLKWKTKANFTYSKNGGRNGTGAAVLTRKSFSGPFATIKLDTLKDKVLYRLSVWVKVQELQSDKTNKNYGAFCVEFVKDGKWSSGYYPVVGSLSKKWQKYQLEFIKKPDNQSTTLTLYMRKGFKGTLYFDDLTLEASGDPAAAILLNAPSQLTILGDKGSLKFTGSSSKKEKKYLTVKVTGPSFNLTKELKESSPSQFTLPLTNLAKGEYKVAASLHSQKTKQQLAKGNFKFFVKENKQQKTYFDQLGNMYVNGKKYLPIGIFGGIQNSNDLKKISDAQFNTILNYTSFGMSFGKKGKNKLDTIKNSFTEIAKHNLKVIFSLKDQYEGMRSATTRLNEAKGIDNVVTKIVNSLKDNPSLLGWYISDEHSRSELQKMISLREKVSSIDYNNPTITLTFRDGDMPIYGTTGDVLAVDNYPIRHKDEKDITPMLKLIKAANLGKQPIWMVPQIFNWGVYRAKNAQDFLNYEYPTSKEINTMLAASISLGCKGFIFYSYSDICGARGKKYFPENEKAQWNNVVNAVSLLKKLEAFILSDKPVEVILDTPSQMLTKISSHNNKSIYIATRHILGRSNLIIKNSKNYSLLSGSAKFDGQNWIFNGKDIDYCILIEK